MHLSLESFAMFELLSWRTEMLVKTENRLDGGDGGYEKVVRGTVPEARKKG